MNTWYQEEHESFVNRLYECKPVKTRGHGKSISFKNIAIQIQKYLHYRCLKLEQN